MKIILILALMHLMLFSCFQLKAIGFEDGVFPELLTSARALAMGNAFISKVDDASSVFYNPAGLGTVRGAQFHLSNLYFEANRGWFKNGSESRIEGVFKNLPKGLSIDGSRELAQGNRGVVSSRRFHLQPNLTMRYLSLGFMYSNQIRSFLGEENTDLFQYAQRVDYGPYAAFNFSLYGGVLKFGLSGVYLFRREAQNEVDPTIEIDLADDEYKEASALVLIGGAKLSLPVALLPTFSAKMNNLSNAEFVGDTPAGDPTQIRRSLDLGFSITPYLSRSIRLHLEVNYRDITNEFTEVASKRKLAFGMEFDVARKFFLRLGHGDGFGSGGIGYRSREMQFDLTSYAVDTSANDFRGVEDRRFAFSFSSGI